MKWTRNLSVCVLTLMLLAYASNARDIHDAVENGSVDDVRRLMAADTTLINVVTNGGNTPLHLACRKGELEIARLLIDAGADLNVINEQGMTPLRQAIKSVNIDMVKLLLDRGATTDDNHPMWGSVMNQAIASTCQRGGGPELVEALIGSGIALDAGKVDGRGMTPLDWAVHFGNRRMAQLALDHGADVNLVSQGLGRTPLVTAVSKGSSELVSMLLEHGADVSVADRKGNPPVYYAVISGRTSILEDLLAHGATTGFEEPHYGRGLAHLAAIRGFRDIAEALAGRGT
ncbi:MAG: ankyrin repeat domain-containing protein, partial [Lysobacterales bacterium]